jgi:hypothetical protein
MPDKVLVRLTDRFLTARDYVVHLRWAMNQRLDVTGVGALSSVMLVLRLLSKILNQTGQRCVFSAEGVSVQ